MNLFDYGLIPTMLPENANGIPARITAVHKDRFEILCELGSGLAHVKTSVYYTGEEMYPTTGDFVMLDWQENGESLILQTLERRTFFSRADPFAPRLRAEQAVAANFDYVFIMQSLNQDFNPRRLERYLTLAWQSGAVPAVLLTKADLIDDFSEQIRIAEKIASNAAVFPISSITGYGVEQLSAYLQPRKTIVFLGSSGVGKSSLVNALAGEDVMAVNSIREDDGKGRHTTTRRQLVLLKSGVMIIDTPGMRALGMVNVTEGVEQTFSDVEEYLSKCRFTNCRHENEPGCAVQEALADGSLSAERWNSYRRLANEAKYYSNKTDYLRGKQQWHKSLSKQNKSKKKAGKVGE